MSGSGSLGKSCPHNGLAGWRNEPGESCKFCTPGNGGLPMSKHSLGASFWTLRRSSPVSTMLVGARSLCNGRPWWSIGVATKPLPIIGRGPPSLAFRFIGRGPRVSKLQANSLTVAPTDRYSSCPRARNYRPAMGRRSGPSGKSNWADYNIERDAKTSQRNFTKADGRECFS